MRVKLIAFCCIMLLIGVSSTGLATNVSSFDYPISTEALYNPYTGNVLWATDNPTDQTQPFSMVYVDVRWSELEIIEGKYDFAALEEKAQFMRWKAEGKHVVFRFVMDSPTKEKHMDIPEWLHEKTGDGTFYSVSYGKGYSPNYNNAVLIEAHARAIRALGERYGNDPFIAFVELGSLGHWGEWHVHEKAGTMPLEAVREEYVKPYVEAFSHAKLMMRRPFTHAAKYGMGIYNDVACEPLSTERWLDWIAQGGDYDETGEKAVLSRMPEAWKLAPIGGELNQSMKTSSMLGKKLEQTIDLFKRSHTSWIGPSSFVNVTRDGKSQSAVDEVMRTIGYRLRVGRMTLLNCEQDKTHVILKWYNDGCAPFYFDWTPVLVLETQNSKQQFKLPMHIIDILPGEGIDVVVDLPSKLLDQKGIRLYVAVQDPANNRPGIQLAMDVPNENGMYLLLER